jgi:DNA-binding response OmpR family regulator
MSSLSTPTILICDDEPNLRELMRVTLGDRYWCIEADDVAASIELAQRLHPDLVLVDVMMPGGSGLQVIERLRSEPELAETPIVVVSALVAASDRLAASEAGATRFLAKPFEPEELETLVEELLAESG